MQHTVKITDKIYWLGVNDRKTRLFENLWPLDKGMSYNSYVIVDEKVALVDTVESGYIDEFIVKLREILQGRKVDYLISNHMEPDHSGAIGAVVREYPDVTVVGNKLTFKMLEAFFSLKNKQKVVANGETLDLGEHQLTFYTTPWVHWPETMMTYDQKEKILFSGDAFGSFGALDGGIFDDEINLDFYEDELRRYYSNIVGKFTKQTQKALKKLSNLDIRIIAATHGPVWRDNLKKILSLYNDWSTYTLDDGVVVVYASMYGHTARMADLTARKMAEYGIKNIRVYDASKTHMSYIINDIWKYKGVILASPTYNGSLHPTMEALVSELKHLDVKDHYLGIFGSFAWNGAALKELIKFSEEIKWEVVAEPIEIKGAMKAEDTVKFTELAKKMADKFNK
ncbi:MAG: FprA family A-type flavoprotein [Bacteroidia bacterium]|nr:MAG: FprA family A-type flavoprotein [Bacteroidia bacterium]